MMDFSRCRYYLMPLGPSSYVLGLSRGAISLPVSSLWWVWSCLCAARSSYRSSDAPVTAASLDSGLSGSAYSLLDEDGETNEVDSAIFQVPRLWVNLWASVSHFGCVINVCLIITRHLPPFKAEDVPFSMLKLLCSYVICRTLFPLSSVERSQTAQTWWNRQWDTVTLKVRQTFMCVYFQNCLSWCLVVLKTSN